MVVIGIFEDGAARANKVSDSVVLIMRKFLAFIRNTAIMVPRMFIASCAP